MTDYEHGERRTAHPGDITKRPRSRAAKRASGPATAPPVSTPFPGGSAPIPYSPHSDCEAHPCDRCSHATLVRLGIRHGSYDLERWEDGDDA